MCPHVRWKWGVELCEDTTVLCMKLLVNPFLCSVIFMDIGTYLCILHAKMITKDNFCSCFKDGDYEKQRYCDGTVTTCLSDNVGVCREKK